MENVFIKEDDTILQAMKTFDESARRTVFIVDEKMKLIAALSEGDVRRFILSGGDLNNKVSEIANYTPKTLKEDDIDGAKEFLSHYNIEGVPIVDDNGIVIDTVFWSAGKRKHKSSLSTPVVMMAGGKGTRLYPYTRILPKPLIPVGEKPIAELIFDGFSEYGINRMIMIVNHKKNMIKSYFGEVEKPYSIEYADEDTPLGTGGGLSLLRGKLDETFILTNCDILIEDDYSLICEHHKKEGNVITMVCSLRNFQVAYGVVEFGEHGNIIDMKEKPEFSFFTNTGIYIVEPEVFDYIKDDEFIGFPDIINRIKEDGKKVGVYPINENSWMDMGQLDELSKMENRLRGK
ncbi:MULTISPECIES: sugar phosphate nucleotidyltransferase [Pseudobutyrivibrio]|uniref:CBS domain-containing protein n=1 Tax=Pseudobutyrivibrio xylanivorans TaxID=185007 RepID=A0A1G5RXD3_PSEXY|nr:MULTISPECIES: sugar phosphate nucleotidyltransferase [Pseudobutyrivibrio]MDC7278867.1 sugar phosphate nucleotidyltransferase [Butyrivibrio fibrisolvens]SCZ78703.1 CBS domain-containing protein [Pseudobutyrivibrio xylanivorans]